MAVLNPDVKGHLHTGQTGPATIIDLIDEFGAAVTASGYAARMIFSYAGSAPHYVGTLPIVGGSSQQVVYDWTGSETPSAGVLTGQVELLNPGSVDQATDEWTVKKLQPLRFTVLQAAA